jgi:hypothetical protein
MNDTDMSIQLREGFGELAEESLDHGSSMQCFFNSCETSNLLTVCMLKVIHWKCRVDSKYLMLGVYETCISDVSFPMVICYQEV